MSTAAASWSNDCASAGSPEGPLRFRATVVTDQVSDQRNYSEINGNEHTPKVILARRMLVISQELHHAFVLTRLELSWPATLASDLEIDAITSFRVDTTHLPGTGVTDTTLCFANGCGLLIQADGVANQSSNFQLLGCQNFERGVEAHKKIVVGVLIKHTRE
jgi:hypothetical protein